MTRQQTRLRCSEIKVMKLKMVALAIAVCFLLTHSGCAPLQKNHMQTAAPYSENSMADFDTQVKKEEKEWMLMVLIILGIAIAVGATVALSSGGSGFSMGVSN